MSSSTSTGGALAALRRYARPRATEEFCELCNIRIAPVHRHLLEVAARRITCACDACALRFQDVVAGRFKLIPRDPRALPGMTVPDAEWESLALPINLAFFFFSTPAQKMVALYPSPAGATESLLPLETWETLVLENPALGTLQPDVEALLVNRVAGAREYLIAPIDTCFELTGIIRMHWRGLSGGQEVWDRIGAFFMNLKETSRA
ncbi:MAG TPA: DUF5947 family protein [Chthoniobacteraceae bacterium]|jgi:hypothetical protein|nr:DUF5947 family protein [Chthoniobacteraceae bacterium]